MIANKMTVIGLGLIGGSICSAAKKYGLADKVVGYDTDSSACEYAEKNGIVDSCLDSLNQKNDSDLIVVATYVDRIDETVREIAPSLGKGCIITDVGSVKSRIVESVESFLDSDLSFIGSHPIAGTEKPGIKYSDPDLFRGNNAVITPSENTKQETIDLVSKFWRTIGSNVLRMDPALHDKIFAYVSHLPHVAAYTLINTLSSSEIENIFSYSGGGLKDYTRIASSSPEMWKTIFMQNKESLLKAIQNFKNNLEIIESAIEEDNLNSLQAILEEAQKNKLLK